MEMHIMIGMMITQLHIFLKTYRFVHLKLVNCIISKLYLNRSDKKSWSGNINIRQHRLHNNEYK